MNFNNLPHGWKLLTIEESMEAIIDYRGKTPKKTESGIPLVTAKIVKRGYILEPFEFIAEDNYDTWMVRGLPKVGDVVMTTEAPLGEAAQLTSDNVALAQRIVTLRGKKGLLDNDYLLCAMQSKFVQDQLESRATGSTVKGIKQSELRKILLPIPPIEEQHKIAKTLKSISNKVMLNSKMNHTLDNTIQAIFQSWFVDFDSYKVLEEEGSEGLTNSNKLVNSELGFIPQGWETGELSEIASLDTTSVKPSKKPDESWEHFSIPAYDEDCYPNFELGSSIKSNKYSVKENSVLVSKLNPRFQRIWVPLPKFKDRAVCSTEFMQFVPINPEHKAFLYCLLKSSSFQNELLNTVTGTTGSRQRAQPKKVACAPIIKPPLELIDNFCKKTSSMLTMIQKNIIESNELSLLRITLLPKMLTGEVRVKRSNNE